MNISGLFIRRPVTTTLIMVGILIFGVLGYKSLPVSDLPTVDFPTITVNANLAGASAETMASSVATPLTIEIRCAKIVWANSSMVDRGSVGEVNANSRMELFAGLTFR